MQKVSASKERIACSVLFNSEVFWQRPGSSPGIFSASIGRIITHIFLSISKIFAQRYQTCFNINPSENKLSGLIMFLD